MIETADRSAARSMFGGLRRLARDRRGAALIEFAFVAGPLIALILAGIQTSLVFFSQQLVDTAAEAAGRRLMTGSTQLAKRTQAQFKNEVCAELPDFMTCANAFVEVRTASDFSGLTTAPPTITYNGSGAVTTAWKYDQPGPQQIGIIHVMYLLPVVGALGFDMADQPRGRRLLIATWVFKTEAYE